MPVDISFSVSNYERVAQMARRMANGETYRGYIKDTITGALQDLTVYTESITHKESGTLASSFRWEYDSHRMKGRIFIAPWTHKLSGHRVQWPYIYGKYEHDRGGEHAFFARAMSERAPQTALRELKANVRAFDV